MMIRRDRRSTGSNEHSSIDPKPPVRLVTAREHKRLEKIKVAFQPERKPKVSLPKFSWDKKDDE